MSGLSKLDLAVIITYLAGITAFGLYVSRRVKDTEGFFMGNRRFGKSLMVAQALTTGTRSDYAIGVVGASYEIGIAGIWYQWMYIFSTPFFWLLSPIFRRMRYTTTADFFEERFSKSLGVGYSFFALYLFMLWQGTIIKGAALTIAGITGVSETWIIWGVTALFVLFGVAGGLVATVNTDFIQGIFIIILSFMLIPFGLSAAGGFSGLHAKLDPQMFSLLSEKELSLFPVTMLIISGLVGIVAQPHHMAVAGSGKTEMNCRVGWCYGNFIKRLCTIGWALTGVIAAVLFAARYDHQSRELVFGAMIKQLLPSGLIGLMIAAIIGTVIASCAAFMVSGSALFTRNLYKKFLKPSADDTHYLLVGRVVSAALTIGSLLFALYMPSVVKATVHFVTIVAFVGIPMWVGIVWPRANSKGAWMSVIGSSTMFFVAQKIGWGQGEQLLSALLVGFALAIIVSLATQPEPADRLQRFFTLLHTPVGEEKNLERVELKNVEENKVTSETQKISDIVPPIPRSKLEEEGHSLLIVDLLRLARTFSYRRYRLDVIGFLLAWLWVVLLLALGYWITRIGS